MRLILILIIINIIQCIVFIVKIAILVFLLSSCFTFYIEANTGDFWMGKLPSKLQIGSRYLSRWSFLSLNVWLPDYAITLSTEWMNMLKIPHIWYISYLPGNLHLFIWWHIILDNIHIRDNPGKCCRNVLCWQQVKNYSFLWPQLLFSFHDQRQWWPIIISSGFCLLEHSNCYPGYQKIQPMRAYQSTQASLDLSQLFMTAAQYLNFEVDIIHI